MQKWQYLAQQKQAYRRRVVAHFSVCYFLLLFGGILPKQSSRQHVARLYNLAMRL